MMASGRGGVSRVLLKLQKNVDDGNYYEAHQMYRTLYFRYNTQKKYAEAIDLLYNGSLTLLKHNQHTSGADLALLLIQTLEKANFPVNEDIFEKIANLHRLIPGELPEKPNYVRSALQWSGQNCPDNKIGHPLLFQKFALNLWKEKNYPKSRYMFLRSVDGEACANMLVEFHVSSGYPSEVDLFIAQAVLQYLCLRNKTTAEVCFNNYTKKHPQVEGGPPFVRPLLNFLWLLLLAVEGGKVAVFTVLCENYQTSLIRDPNYRDYLDRIGQLFFGVPPPKSTGGGLLGNLLQSLLGVEDDEDESGEGAAMSRPHNNMRSDDLD